jgi:hypothetical protein
MQNLFDTCVDANSLVAGIEKEEQVITPLLHAPCVQKGCFTTQSTPFGALSRPQHTSYVC